MKYITNINTNNDLEKVMVIYEKIVLKFSANWCNPCRLVKQPLIDYMNASYDDKTALIEIDVDEFENIDEYFEIKKIPYFIFYKKGNKLYDFSAGNIKEIIDKMETYIKIEFKITEDF